MNKEEIRDKISSIVWHINSNYSPSGAETTIMEIIEKVQEDAYQEGFKAAEEKFNTNKIIFHPGYYVEKYIKELNLSYKQFSNLAGINTKDLTEIINGNKDIDIFYAFRLAYATDTSRMFWLNLQDAYDKNIKEADHER